LVVNQITNNGAASIVVLIAFWVLPGNYYKVGSINVVQNWIEYS